MRGVEEGCLRVLSLRIDFKIFFYFINMARRKICMRST
jgi:hypothetical protein